MAGFVGITDVTYAKGANMFFTLNLEEAGN